MTFSNNCPPSKDQFANVTTKSFTEIFCELLEYDELPLYYLY